MVSGGKRGVLKVFYDNPEEEIHLREIARRANVPVDNAHKYLHDFADRKFVIKRRTEKRVFFRANMRNHFLLKFFELFELERRDNFLEENQEMDLDSILKKFNRSLMIIFLNKEKRILGVVPDCCDKSLIDIEDTVVATQTEFRDLLKDKKFYVKLWGGRIVLYNEFLFWREIARSITLS